VSLRIILWGIGDGTYSGNAGVRCGWKISLVRLMVWILRGWEAMMDFVIFVIVGIVIVMVMVLTVSYLVDMAWQRWGF
jgi:hypothetical protein